MIRTGFFVFFFSILSFSHAITLSDSARISLLTVAPGDELYSAFGHSGIRVTDFKTNMDVVFNYGTFDFNQPNFYVNFVKGRLLYMIDVELFQNFKSMYVYEERAVTEDLLNLTTEEKQHIFSYLYNNAKPENRDYRYEFFFDNCATRIRDVFEKELGKKLVFHYESFDTNYTLKQMLDLYVAKSPWVQFGFYLILGMPCEVKATPRVQAFLPDYLQKVFQTASLQTPNGDERFVNATNVLLDYPLPVAENDFFTPLNSMLLLLLMFVILSIAEWKFKKQFLFFDGMLFGIAGVLGCFFLCMWLFTEHYSVPKNLNMLWAIPLHLPVVFLLMFKSLRKYLAKWFLFTAVLMVVLLLLKGILPQPYHVAVLPVIAALGLRAWLLSIKLK
jgi:hypothetical protein